MAATDLAAFFRPVADDDPLAQGDFLRDVRCLDPHTERKPFDKQIRTVAIISYSCDLDKAQNSVAYVCAYLPFTRESETFRSRIVAGDVGNTMHVPAHASLGESDGYLDFRAIFRVPLTDIGATLAADAGAMRMLADPKRRLVGMMEDAQLALRYRLARFFGFARNDQR